MVTCSDVDDEYRIALLSWKGDNVMPRKKMHRGSAPYRHKPSDKVRSRRWEWQTAHLQDLRVT